MFDPKTIELLLAPVAPVTLQLCISLMLVEVVVDEVDDADEDDDEDDEEDEDDDVGVLFWFPNEDKLDE